MIFSTKPHKVRKNSKLCLKILSQPICEVTEFKFLGILISNNLSWKSHVQQLLNKLRASLAIVYKSRYYLTRSYILALFYSFGYTHLNYCITTWCNNNLAFLENLQNCCNKILRLIYFRNYKSNCDDIYKKHQILIIQDMFKAEVCCFVYKFFHNKLSNCFEGSFRLNSSVRRRSLRRSDDIRPPLVKKSICRESILFTGSKHWNEIPPDIKNCRSLHSFKINLKKYFIEHY